MLKIKTKILKNTTQKKTQLKSILNNLKNQQLMI
jgi:hypothetical protein